MLPRVERTGVLVIRAWIESNGEQRLRARITRTDDLECSEQTRTVVATAEEITAAVTEWLDALCGGGSGDGAVTEQ
jgi:hypothetical protein